MKCPIFGTTFYGMESSTVIFAPDCLREECAVWDKANDQCSIVSFVGLLDGVWSTLDDIKDKMSGEGRVRKLSAREQFRKGVS